MAVTTKNVTLTAVDDTVDVRLAFSLGPNGPTDVRVTIAIGVNGQVTPMVWNDLVDNVPFTISGIASAKMKQALKDCLVWGRSQLGFA